MTQNKSGQFFIDRVGARTPIIAPTSVAGAAALSSSEAALVVGSAAMHPTNSETSLAARSFKSESFSSGVAEFYWREELIISAGKLIIGAWGINYWRMGN
jgi:hypothetical protein